jgi:hypothetical protein
MRAHKLHGAASLVDEALHEGAAPLLAAGAALALRAAMQCLRVHVSLAMFPAIFCIFICCTLWKDRNQ